MIPFRFVKVAYEVDVQADGSGKLLMCKSCRKPVKKGISPCPYCGSDPADLSENKNGGAPETVLDGEKLSSVANVLRSPRARFVSGIGAGGTAAGVGLVGSQFIPGLLKSNKTMKDQQKLEMVQQGRLPPEVLDEIDPAVLQEMGGAPKVAYLQKLSSAVKRYTRRTKSRKRMC